MTKSRVLFDPLGDSHEDIIAANGLNDRKGSPDFVRVEVVPPNLDYTLPFDKWVYKVDQDWLPDWYCAAEAEAACRAVLPEWARTHIVRSGKHTCERGQTLIAIGCVVIVDGGECNACAGSTVTVNDGRCHARAGSVATVNGGWCDAYAGSTVTVNVGWCHAYAGSTVTVNGGWCVALDGSTVTVNDGRCYARAGSTVTVNGGVCDAHAGSAVMVSGGVCDADDGSKVIDNRKNDAEKD